MVWPEHSDIVSFVVRSSALLAVSLGLGRVFRTNVRFRDVLWPATFGALLLLLAPIPAIHLPLVERKVTMVHAVPRVYEQLPGFASITPTYAGDPGPPASLVALVLLAAVGLAVFAWQSYRSWRLVRGAEQVVDPAVVELLYEVSERHRLNDAPLVVLSDGVDSPCIVGVLNPTLVLPADALRTLKADELGLILSHEIGHVRRHDTWRLTAMSAIRSLLWWNPLIWWAYRAGVRSIEEANDRTSILNPAETQTYTQLLLGRLVPRPVSLLARFFGQGNVLGRIRMLNSATPSSNTLAPLAGLMLLVPTIVPVDLSWTRPLERDRFGYDEVMFGSLRTGSPRTWRMKSDGSHQTSMADTFVNAATPAISPDGRLIAYAKGKDLESQNIYIANVDGTGERVAVATPDRDYGPKWSPDGRTIAFETRVTGTWNLAVVDVATGKWRLLTHDRLGNLEPSWHPNGQRLIFSSHRSGVQNLWSIGLDGRDLVQVTNGTWEDTGASYSRDGRYVVFSSYRRWKYDLWMLDLATRRQWPLNPIERLDVGEGRFVDGDTAIVCSMREGNVPQIGRVGLDGTGFHAITCDNLNTSTATR